jgi:hypothetical protein
MSRATDTDPWLPRTVPRCTVTHGPWITYQSLHIVQCADCDYEEPMYLSGQERRPLPPADEATVRAARAASLAP